MSIIIPQPPTPFVGINAPELTNGKLWWDTDDATPIITPGYRYVVVKTDSYIATTADDVIVCNKGSSMAITLPTATGGGKYYAIANIGAGNVTVSNVTDTINGEASQIVQQWATMEIIDYAANVWVIV